MDAFQFLFFLFRFLFLGANYLHYRFRSSRIFLENLNLPSYPHKKRRSIAKNHEILKFDKYLWVTDQAAEGSSLQLCPDGTTHQEVRVP